MLDKKTELVARIISENHKRKIYRLLVVGCGAGIEAAVLARTLGVDVVGIDVVDKFDPDSKSYATLQLGDAMSLDFADCSFDFVYSYHALEHIPDPELALQEMQRVLKAGGGYWIGTPNRSRVVGYLGSQGVALKDKVKWNVADWKARLSGRFTNEKGAHAGFSRAELRRLIRAEFSAVNDMSDAYFAAIYGRYRLLLNILRWSRSSNIFYPSVYFMGRK